MPAEFASGAESSRNRRGEKPPAGVEPDEGPHGFGDAQTPANPTCNRKGDPIIGDVDDYRARDQCPRCGALSRQPCEAVRPGASLVGYHRERGYRQGELLKLGYIKYTLVNESTQHRLFLWRRRTQRPIIRDGYRLSD